MSYTSESILKNNVTLKQVREVVELLGYKKVPDGLKVPNRTDSMMWIEQKDYKSWVGVELDIYRENRQITVTTRSRVGRSYWDLIHQNKTLKTLRDLFGGHFTTDAGRNRYWRPESDPPSPVMSGCYLARWRFANALVTPRIYLQQRELKGQIAQPEPTGLPYVDQMNPRLFSNNLVLPYIVGIWEEYFKSTFIVLLKYSDNKRAALKKVKLSQSHLEAIAAEERGVEEALGETLSFQRPSIVTTNFKLLDQNLDISGVLKMPYRRRRISLYESIESFVEQRNSFVHTGEIDTNMTDRVVKKVINDFAVGIDRAYDLIAKRFDFYPLRDF
jgi:hypothetical protein